MMSLLLYLAVLLVSLSSVLFGLGWLSAPEPHYATPPAQVAIHAPEPKAVPRAAPSPATPIAASAVPQAAKSAVVAAPQAAPAPQTIAETAAAPDAAPAIAAPSAEVAATPPEPAPACDVAACTRAYHTFTASDCTYQPSDGPRRICTKGTRKTAAAIDARAQATQAQACNVAACDAAYRSFDASDCTYQPSHGPRRLCAK